MLNFKNSKRPDSKPKTHDISKPLFWVLTIFGMIVGGGTILISIFISTISETVGVIGQSSSSVTGFLLLLLGAALTANCYMLTKGVDPARLIYAVLMGIESLLMLALLMTGMIDFSEYRGLAPALFVIFVLFVCSAAIMPTSKGIKEYMYDLETEKVDKNTRG